MKKLLTSVFCLSMLTIGLQAANADEVKPTAQKYGPRPPYAGKQFKKQMPKFDEILNLTDQQKELARQNRIKGRKQMKPIMDEIRAKKEAILDIKDSNLSEAEQQAQIKVKQQEIKELWKKANVIREENMKEFEKILTKDQKATLEKFKKEHQPKGCPNCKKNKPFPPMED